MTIKALKEAMRFCYENDKESYDELWTAVRTLSSLGLIESKLTKAMVEEDHKLFEEDSNNG